jgi:uncharacterized protein YoxC
MGLLDSINDKKPEGNKSPSDSTLLGSNGVSQPTLSFDRVSAETKTPAPDAKTAPAPQPEKKDDRSVAGSFFGAIKNDVVGLGGLFFNTDPEAMNMSSTSGAPRASLASLGGTGMGASLLRSGGGLAKTIGVIWDKPTILTDSLADAGRTLVSGNANDRAALAGHGIFFLATMGGGGAAASKASGLLGDARAASVAAEGMTASTIAEGTLGTVQRMSRVEGLTTGVETVGRVRAAEGLLTTTDAAGGLFSKVPRLLPEGGSTSFLTQDASKLGTMATDLKTAGTFTVRPQIPQAWEIANPGLITKVPGEGFTALDAKIAGLNLGADASKLELGLGGVTRFESPLSSTVAKIEPGLGSTVAKVESGLGSTTAGIESTFGNAATRFEPLSPVATRVESTLGNATRFETTLDQRTASILENTTPVAEQGGLKSQVLAQVETHTSEVTNQLASLRRMEQVSGNPAVQDALTYIERNAGKTSEVTGGALKQQMSIVENALGTEATAGLRNSVTRLEQSATQVQNLSAVEGAVGKFSSNAEQVLAKLPAQESGPMQQVIAQFEKGNATIQDVRNTIEKLAVKEPEAALQLTREFGQVENAMVQNARVQSVAQVSSTIESTLPRVAVESRPALQEVQQTLTRFEQGTASIQDLRQTVQQLAKSEPEVAAQLTRELGQVEKTQAIAKTVESTSAFSATAESSLSKVAVESRPAVQEVQQAFTKFEQGTASIQDVQKAVQTLSRTEPEVAAQLTQKLNQVETATVAANRVESVSAFTTSTESAMTRAAVESRPAVQEVQQAFTKFEQGTASMQDVKVAVQNLAKNEPQIAAQLTNDLAQVEKVTAAANRVESVSAFTTSTESAMTKVAVESRPAVQEVQQAFTKFEQGTASIQDVQKTIQTLSKSEPEIAAQMARDLGKVENATVTANRVESVSAFTTSTESAMTKVAVESRPAVQEVQQAFTKFEQGTASVQEVKTAVQTLAKSEPEVAAQLSRELNQVERATVNASRVETAASFNATTESAMTKVASESRPFVQEVQQAFTKFEQGTASVQEVKTAVQTLAKSEPEVAAQLSRELNQVERATVTANRVETAASFNATTESAMAKVAVESRPAVQEVQQAFRSFEQGTASVQEVKTAVQTLAKSEPEVAAQLSRELNQVERTAATANRIETAASFNATTESAMAKVAVESRPAVQEVQQAFRSFEQGTASVQEVKTAVQTLAKSEPEVAAQLSRELSQVERATVTANRVESAAAFNATTESAMTKVAVESRPAVQEVQQAFRNFEQGTASVQEVKTAVQTLAKSEPEVAAQLSRELNQVERTVATANRIETAASFNATTESAMAKVASESRPAVQEVQQAFRSFEQGTASVQEVKTAVQTLAKSEPEVAAQLSRELSQVERATVTANRVESAAAFNATTESAMTKVALESRPAVQEVQQAFRSFEQGTASVQEVKTAVQTLAKSEPEVAAQLSRELNQVERTAATANRIETAASFNATTESAMAKVAVESRPAVQEVQQAFRNFEQGTASVQEVKTAVQTLSKSEPEVAAQLSRELNQVERASVVADRVEATSKLANSFESTAAKVAVENQPLVRELQSTWTKFEEGSASASDLRNGVQKLAAREPEAAAQLVREINQAEKLTAQANQLRTAEFAATNLTDASAYYGGAVRDSASQAAAKVETLSAGAKVAEADTAGLKSIQQSLTKVSADGPAAMAEIKSTMQTLSPRVAEELQPSITSLENAVNGANRIKTADALVATATDARATLSTASEAAVKSAPAGGTDAVNAFNQAATRTIVGADNSAAIAEMRNSLKSMDSGVASKLTPALDKFEAASVKANQELFDLHGSRMAQNIANLREAGNLGTGAQIERLELVRNDLAVMKSLVPQESATFQQLAKLDRNVQGMESISNILSHPEVARASYRDLLKLAASSDASVATAAADKLILTGKAGAMAESPVVGLISERMKFWNTQSELLEAERASKLRLMLTGRVAGLAKEDAYMQELLSARRWTLFGAAAGGLLGGLGEVHGQIQRKEAAALRTAEAEARAAASKGGDVQKADATTRNAEPINAKPGDVQKAAVTEQRQIADRPLERTSYAQTVPQQQGTSNQAVFRANTEEVRMPVVAKFLPQEHAAFSARHSMVNTNGKDWWWMANQHGGNWTGYLRGPGAPAAVETSQPQVVVQQQARIRGISTGQTTEPDRVKIAFTGFNIPRTIDMRSPVDLLNETRGIRRPATQISAIGGFNTVQSSKSLMVDWSQGINRTGAATEGRTGHKMNHLGPLEAGEEVAIDAPGSGVSGGGNADPNNMAQVSTAQTSQDDEQGKTGAANQQVLASATTPRSDDEQDALVTRI